MKGFWIALLLLLMLTGGVFLTAHRVDGVLDAMTETLTENRLDELKRLWEKNGALLRLTLHQGEMTQIDERLAALNAAASLGDESAYRMEAARLLSALSRVRESVSPSLLDIF